MVTEYYMPVVHQTHLLPLVTHNILAKTEIFESFSSQNSYPKKHLILNMKTQKLDIKKHIILLIRILALIATFLAAIIIATSHEKANIFTISFEAKYSDTPALKYFLITNIIVSIYGLLILFLPPDNFYWKFVIIPDVVVIVLLSSSISAGVTIGDVGKKGNFHAGWLPICGQFHKYCDQVTAALTCGLIGFFMYLVLLLCSFYSLLQQSTFV